MDIKKRHQKSTPKEPKKDSNKSRRFIVLLVTATAIGASIWGVVFTCLDSGAYAAFEMGMAAKRQGDTALAGKRFAEAETAMRNALEAHKKERGEIDPEIANDKKNLARVLAEEGKDTEAEDLYASAIALYEKFNGQPLSDYVGSLSYYGDHLVARGRYLDAETVYNKALSALGSQPSNKTYRAWTLERLARVYDHTQRKVEATKMRREAELLQTGH